MQKYSENVGKLGDINVCKYTLIKAQPPMALSKGFDLNA